MPNSGTGWLSVKAFRIVENLKINENFEYENSF